MANTTFHTDFRFAGDSWQNQNNLKFQILNFRAMPKQPKTHGEVEVAARAASDISNN
jgi:hypothetical protein